MSQYATLLPPITFFTLRNVSELYSGYASMSQINLKLLALVSFPHKPAKVLPTRPRPDPSTSLPSHNPLNPLKYNRLGYIICTTGRIVK